jgi:hypothetical protein
MSSSHFEYQTKNAFINITLIISGIIIIALMIRYDIFGFSNEYFDTVNSDNEKNLANIFSTNDYRIDDNVEGDIILDSDETDKRDYIDEGRMEGIVAHSLKCSKSCCGTNWPAPPELSENDNIDGRGFVRTNMTCGNGSGGTGCVCIPRSVRKLYERRGGVEEPGFI